MTKFKMGLIHDQMEKMKKGTKKIELRVNDEKRKSIVARDCIEFHSTENNEILSVTVLKRLDFETFDELYQLFTPIELGYDEGEEADADDMLDVYSTAQILEHGVVGFLFEVKEYSN